MIAVLADSVADVGTSTMGAEPEHCPSAVAVDFSLIKNSLAISVVLA